jgi:hypothetical protein
MRPEIQIHSIVSRCQIKTLTQCQISNSNYDDDNDDNKTKK